MEIAVIFTGGTIGSIAGDDGYISPDRGNPHKLLDMYQKLCDGREDCIRIDFHTEEPFQILSENMNAEYLNQLILCVKDILKKHNDKGIIITHGTDTLQYTAAVLSYIFGKSCIPIILVSSDFPLEDDRANGLVNFTYAVDFIKSDYGTGVFVCYRNQKENPVIHRATKLLSHIPYSSALYSVKNCYYGEYRENKYLPNLLYHSECFSGQECFDSINDIGGEDLVCRLCENEGSIMWIHPYVGINYPAITDKVKVVLHDSYHSGTIGVSEELKRFMEEAQNCKVPVYITGIAGDEKNYETVRDYQKLGIHIISGISPIAAYCKLWLALSNGLDIRRVMEACIAEDIC